MILSRRHKTYDLTIDPARGRARREVVGALGAFILFFNVLAATLLGASAHAGSPMLGDLNGDRIVICTGAGMIVVDHNGKPVEQKSGEAGTLCPFCVPLMQGCAAPPTPLVAAAAPVAGKVLAHTDISDAPLALEHRGIAAAPRGPPSA